MQYLEFRGESQQRRSYKYNILNFTPSRHKFLNDNQVNNVQAPYVADCFICRLRQVIW